MPKGKAPSALPISGQVTARSPYGIKIEGIEDWLNFSKKEYRKEPGEADDVQKGDWVNMEVSGTFIKSICLIEPPTGESMVRRAGDDPFEGFETAPVEGEHVFNARNPIATNREQSIQRQVALKCAVELAIGMAGPPPAGGVAGPINADYVVMIYRKFAAALNETGE